MKKPQEWVVQLDGQSYAMSLIREGKRHIVTVNGIPTEIPIKWKDSFVGVESAIMLGNRQALFVMTGKKPDIVVDGQYLSNGKKYVQMPGWAWVFVILNLLMIVGLGAIPFLMGFGGAALCARASRSTLPTVARVLICVGITLLLWILFILLVVVAAMAS